MTASTPRLPSDKTPETITLEEALGLIAARAERTGGGKRPAGKGAKKAKAEAAKPKKAKGKAKPADATDDADGGVDAEKSGRIGEEADVHRPRQDGQEAATQAGS